VSPSCADLAALSARLREAADVQEVVALAPVEACHACGFECGVLLRVESGQLVANDARVADDASEWLRRAVAASPVQLEPGTVELQAIRTAEGFEATRTMHMSAVARTLGLVHPVFAAIAPAQRALAVLILDRPGPAVDDDAQAAVDMVAREIGHAIERAILRQRLCELESELRFLTSSAQALIREAADAPLALTTDHGHGAVFVRGPRAGASGPTLRERLTDRERMVLDLMGEGLSNRQIGARLHLAPDTVKDHVTRILAKVGARNRVDAVVKSLQSGQPPPGGNNPPEGGL
jgi:DNA-binding CsgD family transcriptional regulator/GAF domain-containing protein